MGRRDSRKGEVGAGVRKGRSEGKGERGKTDRPEGVERKVLGGKACGGVGHVCGRSGTDTEIWSSSVRTSRVRQTGRELACKHGVEKGETDKVSSRRG